MSRLKFKLSQRQAGYCIEITSGTNVHLVVIMCDFMKAADPLLRVSKGQCGYLIGGSDWQRLGHSVMLSRLTNAQKIIIIIIIQQKWLFHSKVVD